MAAEKMVFGFGVFPYSYVSFQEMIELAKLGETLGYYAITLPEHLLTPNWPQAPISTKFWYDTMVIGGGDCRRYHQGQVPHQRQRRSVSSSGADGQVAGDARRGVGRTGAVRRRQRLDEGGVPPARNPLQGARRDHRRVPARDEGTVDQRRAAVRGQICFLSKT